MSKKKRQNIVGYIKRHPDGFGFLIPDDIEFPDVYIPKKHMIGIMSNDKLEVEVRPEPDGDRFRGKVIKILERGLTQATGKLHRLNENEGILLDASKAWGENLHVNLHGHDEFKEGDWASVEIVTYPGSDKGFSGEVVKIIGDSLNPNNDNMRVLYGHQVPLEFSEKTLAEIKKLPDQVTELDCLDRKDLRKEFFITIDGVTAKDFDDAICVNTAGKGFNLKVAIADVSHYVQPDTALDRDAYERGTSTYLPNFVAPMLPEKLSNNLCSLRPSVPRLALVADMQIDFQGSISSTKVYEAVIESKARVTYGEAQEVVDGSTPQKLLHVEKNIKVAADLAKILMAKRFKEGSLSMEIPETELEVDEAGQVVDIIKADRLFSHKLIEEMMLIANVAVARFLHSKNSQALYRVHDSPDEEKVKKLELYMHNFGVSKKLSGGKLQKKISRALQAFHDRPQEHILHILTLRSMSQAIYAPENIGHFGLGFDDYVHFTSPIRRYPDLIIHRLLKSIICPEKGYKGSGQGNLDSAGTHLSACEQRSVKAERQLVSIKKARFMEDFLGKSFEGMVSSVAKFGVFVLLRRYDVDGLVRVEELGKDQFEFDEENLRLTGRRTGKVYNLGDPIKVIVASVDSDEGRIDFLVDGHENVMGQKGEPRHRREKSKARGKRGGKPNRSGKKKAKPAETRLSLKTNRRSLRKTRVSKSRGKSKTR